MLKSPRDSLVDAAVDASSNDAKTSSAVDALLSYMDGASISCRTIDAGIHTELLSFDALMKGRPGLADMRRPCIRWLIYGISSLWPICETLVIETRWIFGHLRGRWALGDDESFGVIS